MKKASSKQRPARKPSGATIQEYMARVPEQSRLTFDKLRATVKSAVPKDATETISYGIPAFKGKKVLVWYAAFAKHCSLFPTAAVIAQFEDELEGYTVSKGTVHFPLDKPLPTALIKKMVKARVAQA